MSTTEQAPRRRRFKLGGKATVECGVCGREKVGPDTPGAIPCDRTRDPEGTIPCTAHIIKEAPSG